MVGTWRANNGNSPGDFVFNPTQYPNGSANLINSPRLGGPRSTQM